MKTDKELTSLTYYKLLEFKDELDQEVFEHLIWMLLELGKHKEDTRKTNRWLGFIHGSLVALTDCTVNELRDICR